MLYYGDRTRAVRTSDAGVEILRRIEKAGGLLSGLAVTGTTALPVHTELVAAAMGLGEVHQALADQLNPLEDGTNAATDALSEASISLGQCVAISSAVSFWRQRNASPQLASLLPHAAAQTKAALGAVEPTTLEPRVPEGYAYYCLYPEMYLASLRRVLADFPGARRFVVIGLRSIGTSLAGLVSGALRAAGLAATAETIRPRGHPFHRFVAAAPALQTRFREAATAGSRFIVVDEGPGLTCSSFLSVATLLGSLGVAEDEIILLSAWKGAPSIMAPEGTRQRWSKMRVYHTPAADAFEGWRSLASSVRVSGNGQGEGWAPDPEMTVDISHGRWREHSYADPAAWPVVHGATERVKLLLRPPQNRPDRDDPAMVVAKFAGLGSYGEEKLARARVMAGSRFCLPSLGLAYGFILHPFLPGSRPLGREDLTPELVSGMGSYYAFVGNHFRLPSAQRYDGLAKLISHNCTEAGIPGAGEFLAGSADRGQNIDALPLTLLDGHPRPHEWISVDGHHFKTDSWDHFADHTLVGEQSVLWDLAGAMEEWGMNRSEGDLFLLSWLEAGGDLAALPFLDFYRAAYLSLRLAELHYAVHSTDEDLVRQSLQEEFGRYRGRLADLIHTACPAGRMES